MLYKSLLSESSGCHAGSPNGMADKNVFKVEVLPGKLETVPLSER